LHVEDVVFPCGESVELWCGFDVGYEDFRANIVSLFGETEADTCICELMETVDL
jgi:hypothetical protein